MELPHSLVGSPQAAALAAAVAPAAPTGGAATAKRPPLHPGAAKAGGGGPPAPVAPPASDAKGLPRLRSVPAIPQQEDIEKQQPGVTAQPDDSRLLSSPSAGAAAAAGMGAAAALGAAADAQEGEAGSMWRSLLEEQLR